MIRRAHAAGVLVCCRSLLRVGCLPGDRRDVAELHSASSCLLTRFPVTSIDLKAIDGSSLASCYITIFAHRSVPVAQ